MLKVVLVEPQIPPNTGNVIRLCANVGAALHLVRPLGFDIDDASLRRAGLDYHEFVDMTVHDDLAACRAAIDGTAGDGDAGGGKHGGGAAAGGAVGDALPGSGAGGSGGAVGDGEAAPRWYAFSRHATRRYDEVRYGPDDVLVFGTEATGLAPEVRASFGSDLIALPMRPDNRSVNLSNSVAVVAYEAWRQLGFPGAAPLG